ncbi:hypothetical protein ACFSMW_20010 [Virgibacillus halophilus]
MSRLNVVLTDLVAIVPAIVPATTGSATLAASFHLLFLIGKLPPSSISHILRKLSAVMMSFLFSISA